MVQGRGGRDKVKPRRGGPRHFTVHPRDIYMKEGRPEGSEDESSSTESQDEDEIVQKVQVLEIGCSKRDEDDESSEEEQKPPPPRQPRQQPIPKAGDAPQKSPRIEDLAKKPPHELTRKEREAIEKERAKQHFLKMKEKEDGARLAVIRKQREEAAAKAAAEKKAKEEARLRNRE